MEKQPTDTQNLSELELLILQLLGGDQVFVKYHFFHDFYLFLVHERNRTYGTEQEARLFSRACTLPLVFVWCASCIVTRNCNGVSYGVLAKANNQFKC